MTPTHFDAFKNDPRIADAKKLMLDALQSHQSKLTKPQAAHENLKLSYDALIAKFGEIRGGSLWFPYIGSGLGNGALVELADGSVKYDFISGIGVHFGHSHPDVIEAQLNAAIQDTVMHGNLQQNRQGAEFSDLLIKASGFDHCFLTTSGAMACENALKIAFQKKSPAKRILAFERCFMGRTLYLSQITDKAAYREGLPATALVDYVPFFDAQNPEESTKKTLAAIDTYLKRYPGDHAAMCMELVQGEGGYYAGSRDFFVAIMGLLKKNNVAVIVDEVQSFGRTPSLFVFQELGLQDFVDLVTVGKLTQVCATLFRSDFKPRAGLISQTFTASSSALEAGIVILKSLLEKGYLGPQGKIQSLSQHFVAKLQDLAHRYPDHVQGPFGMGLMVAVTLLAGDKDKVTAFIKRLYENGVLSFMAGTHPMRVRFLPPIGSVTTQDIDAVVAIVESTLKEFI